MKPEGEAGAMEKIEFPAFPFTPYPIQLQFMTAVYRALQKGGVAIVESPTGLLSKPLSVLSRFVHFKITALDVLHRRFMANSVVQLWISVF